MSATETFVCRNALWAGVARHVVLPWALQGLRPSGELLELGAGNGAMAGGLAVRFPRLRITTTDVDPAMVAAARRRLAGRGNVNVTTADVTDLPFPDESFDFVTSFLMLHHVVEWHSAVAEAARMLRPGGTLAGYDLTDTRLATAVHRVDGSPHQLIAAEELDGALREVGLEEVTVRVGFAGHVMR